MSDFEKNFELLQNFDEDETEKEITFKNINEEQKIDVIDRLFNISDDNVKFLINIGDDNYYTLTDKTLNLIYNSLEGEVEEINENSKKVIIDAIKNNDELKIEMIKNKGYKTREGAFLKYICKDENLYCKEWERYGLYNCVDSKNYINNCFYNSLKNQGMTKKKLQKLNHYMKNKYVRISDIKYICDFLDIEISITKNRTQKAFKKGDSKDKYYLCLFEEHFFPYDNKTNITEYAIKNYNKIKHLDNWKQIIRVSGNHIKYGNNFVSSLRLIELLLNFNHLSKIKLNGEIMKTTHYNEVKEIGSLIYDDDMCKKPIPKCGMFSRLPKVYFDLECESVDIHKPYYVGCIKDNKFNGYMSKNCIFDFLNSITEPSLLIAHNLGYDFRFLINYLYEVKYIPKGRKIISASGFYYNKKLNNKKIKLHFIDSASIIPTALKKFPKMFKINTEDIPIKFVNNEVGKETYPYSYYTGSVLRTLRGKIDDALKHINEKDKEHFLKTLELWDIKKGESFRHWKLCENYCKIDCYLLKIGFERFRDSIYKIMNDIITDEKKKQMQYFYEEQINNCEDFEKDLIKKPEEYYYIENYVSISSIANSIFTLTDCYEDVYSFSCQIREFISKCIIGGRVMSKNNKRYHIKTKIDDFDACSLYPSAMERLSREYGGYLKGKPKIITNKNYESIKNYDGYFVEIKITDVGKTRGITTLNYKNKEGLREYRNDLIGYKIHVDKTTLEDLIEYHKIKFKIIKGYCFNEGRNPKIGEVIRYLYDERVKQKKLKNPIQEVLKLIMNSAYGRTILKPIEHKYKVFNNEKKAKSYVVKNYNKIINFQKIKNNINNIEKYTVKEIKTINNHFNMPHVGAEVLSMSKRIMNEVIYTCEDNGMDVFYTDTDSMHIPCNQIKKLEELYNKKYNKKLIGNDMGQFHCDFALNGTKKDTPIYSKECIILGKKAYYDKVCGIDDNGDDIYDDHITLKGISNKSLGNNILNIYKRLLNNETLQFDLAKAKPIFEFSDDMLIKSKKEFLRKVQFVDKNYIEVLENENGDIVENIIKTKI